MVNHLLLKNFLNVAHSTSTCIAVARTKQHCIPRHMQGGKQIIIISMGYVTEMDVSVNKKGKGHTDDKLSLT